MRVVGHRVRLTGEHMELMRIPRRFWESSVSGIPDSVKDKVLAYVRQINDFIDDGVGLLLWGPNGVGKTCAAVVIAKEARRVGAPVLFVTAEGLRQAVLENHRFHDGLIIERAREVEVLVLDDLGKEYSGQTGYTERLFEDLVRQRSAARKLTIVTSNMGVNVMREHYKPSMIEVMKESLYPIKVEGESQRDDAMSDIAARLSTG